MTPDFWLSSGFHLLRRDGAGRLAVTDDFLRAYLSRPELRPVAESCAAEIALYEAVLAEPRLAVPAERLDELADADARDSYRAFLGLRDLLVREGTVEAAYLALWRSGAIDLPPLFVDQMAHVVLRNVLDGCAESIRLRAAELLFRAQKVTLGDGTVMVADEETVEMHAAGGGPGGQLLGAGAAPARQVELDVLDDAHAAAYWARSDRFDTVLDIGFARPGLDALCRVLEAWVRHFLAAEVSIQPVKSIRDERWVWHVGLDAEASAILNDLYDGRAVDEARLYRLLSLFRLEFQDPARMLPRLAGRPVYLGMAMTPANVLRLKPQNLLVNLPLAAMT